MRNFLAEFMGTFCLIFVGTGAIIINDVSNGAITHLGISMTFGLIVMTLIYAFGDISGAHFNPAVTIAFWKAQRFPGKFVFPYIGGQCLGGILGSLLLRYLFPTHATLGSTLPGIPLMRTFIFELFLAALLILVILNVTTGSKEKGLWAGLAIGGTVGVEALFAGPISGASMNPIRSLAPALVSGNYLGIWIYLIAPLVAAFLVPYFYRLLHRAI